MSERVTSLLKSAGLTDPALNFLERGNAIFVLTRHTLLYQDDGGIRRVTLRDLTRVHSDQEGLLRVETPAGTALTASLVGFDPTDVQKFFREVQATTAKAKESVPGMGAAASPLQTPPSTPPSPTPVSPPPASLPPRPQASWGNSAGAGLSGSASPLGNVPPAAKLPARPVTPSAGPNLDRLPPVEESVTVIRPDGQRERTVTQPVSVPPPGSPETADKKVAPTVLPSPIKNHRDAPPQRDPRPEVKPEPVAMPPVTPAPSTPTPPSAAATKPPTAPAPKPVAAAPAPAEVVEEEKLEPVNPLSALAAVATNTGAWVGRLRFLGFFLLLAVLALAYLMLFQYDQGLSGIWLLIAGGMSSVALMALADVVKLLVGIARALEQDRSDER